MKQLLIVGCGRSGTLYTSRLLAAYGFDVGHERMGVHGAIGFSFAGEMRYMNAPRVLLAGFDLVLHQVREPLATIGSMTTHVAAMYRWYESVLGMQRFRFRPPAGDTERRTLLNAMGVWVAWNQYCARRAQWTYRVESLRSPSMLRDLLDRLPWPIWLPDEESQGRPERLDVRTNARQHRVVEWQNLLMADENLACQVARLAKGYGYPADLRV